MARLNTEREELLGKIEVGDGAANTAIQQLKLQNVSRAYWWLWLLRLGKSYHYNVTISIYIHDYHFLGKYDKTVEIIE